MVGPSQPDRVCLQELPFERLCIRHTVMVTMKGPVISKGARDMAAPCDAVYACAL